MPERVCGCCSPRRLPDPAGISWGRTGPASPRLVGPRCAGSRAGSRGRRKPEGRIALSVDISPSVSLAQVPRPRQCLVNREPRYKGSPGDRDSPRSGAAGPSYLPSSHEDGVGRSPAPSRSAEKRNSRPLKAPSTPGEKRMTVADLSS